MTSQQIVENLRRTGERLLALADELEVEDSVIATRPAFANFSSDDFAHHSVATLAKAEYKARALRAKFFPSNLFGEPVWDIMLDLFSQTIEGKQTSVTSSCIASHAPSTTALRYIGVLEQQQIISRRPDPRDARKTYLEFEPAALNSMQDCLAAQLAAFNDVDSQRPRKSAELHLVRWDGAKV